MKWSIFKFSISLLALFVATDINAFNLMPSHICLQSGGGMGIISAGVGWSYGSNDRWETDINIGFLPKHNSTVSKAIISLKENFIPWNIRLNDSFHLEPLSTSLYFTSILNNKFWAKQPDRYPSDYYLLPTKFRINIAIGQRINYKLPDNRLKIKSLTAFYELSTCDIYVLSAFGNKYIKPHNWLQLCIGIKINI